MFEDSRQSFRQLVHGGVGVPVGSTEPSGSEKLLFTNNLLLNDGKFVAWNGVANSVLTQLAEFLHPRSAPVLQHDKRANAG